MMVVCLINEKAYRQNDILKALPSGKPFWFDLSR
jgi:hypothetical protein